MFYFLLLCFYRYVNKTFVWFICTRTYSSRIELLFLSIQMNNSLVNRIRFQSIRIMMRKKTQNVSLFFSTRTDRHSLSLIKINQVHMVVYTPSCYFSLPSMAIVVVVVIIIVVVYFFSQNRQLFRFFPMNFRVFTLVFGMDDDFEKCQKINWMKKTTTKKRGKKTVKIHAQFVVVALSMVSVFLCGSKK